MLDGDEAGAESLAATVEAAGLVYVTDADPGIRRIRAGRGFSYRDGAGRLLRDASALARIRSLAIPPAYTDVWICPLPNGHIQATGRDAKGRKQYRYHADWHGLRDATKYERLLEFGESLPALRRRIAADMAPRGLSRGKVLATIVALLENTLIRVGNADYVRQNDSFGLTTLRDGHVTAAATELRFRFKGKSGRTWNLSVRDRRIARIVRACQDLPGQHLFQYLDDDGRQVAVTSADVNSYLREISGRDITAKDFRTWAGTVLAARAIAEALPPETAAAGKRSLRAAIETVAARLGNTPTIARKSYVHPEIVRAYLEEEVFHVLRVELSELRDDDGDGWRPGEAAVLSFLRRQSASKGNEPEASRASPLAA